MTPDVETDFTGRVPIRDPFCTARGCTEGQAPRVLSLAPQLSRSVGSDSLRPAKTAARQASLSVTNSWSLLKLMPIESVMPSSHLTLCRPLLLPPSIFPSIRVFSNESALYIIWSLIQPRETLPPF